MIDSSLKRGRVFTTEHTEDTERRQKKERREKRNQTGGEAPPHSKISFSCLLSVYSVCFVVVTLLSCA
jgi:hypothetical protein